MNKVSKSITYSLVAIIGISLSIYLISRPYSAEEEKGLRNVEICKSLEPGINIDHLHKAFGEPESKKKRNGNFFLYYEPPPVSSSMISAEIDSKTGKVVELWCGDEFNPQWSLKNKRGAS